VHVLDQTKYSGFVVFLFCFRLDMVHLPGKGVGARRVPLLLTPDVLPVIDVLLSRREECGVPPDNVYFFAVPASYGYLNGWQTMDRVSREADLLKPELIHSTRLRKYAATVTQVLMTISSFSRF